MAARSDSIAERVGRPACADSHMEDLTYDFASVGAQRLLAMAALYIAIELREAIVLTETLGGDGQSKQTMENPRRKVTLTGNNFEPGALSGNASS